MRVKGEVRVSFCTSSSASACKNLVERTTAERGVISTDMPSVSDVSGAYLG